MLNSKRQKENNNFAKFEDTNNRRIVKQVKVAFTSFHSNDHTISFPRKAINQGDLELKRTETSSTVDFNENVPFQAGEKHKRSPHVH